MARIDELRSLLSADPRRWLVTGAAGFIGSHLVEELLGLGQEVVGLDNLSTGTMENIEFVRAGAGKNADRFEFVEGDICDFNTCRDVSSRIDHVLHQAALGSVPRSIADPRATHDANVDGFVNVVLAARDAGARTVVYASSSSVYGDSEVLPKQEDTLGAPLSPYALSKRVNELYAETYARSFNLSVVGLRYFNVFGPRQRPDGPYAAVIPKWLAQLAGGERPMIFGDGETSRDFCPVANSVQANLLAALVDPDPQGTVYNVALGGRTTLNELCALLTTAMRSVTHTSDDLEPVYGDFRPGDVRHSHADISRARRDLGYEPLIDLAEGIRVTVDAFVHTTGV